MPRERIGLLGGTFNPIHQGHLRAAEEVKQKFSLQKVLFIPSFIPPHKMTAEMASPEDRFAMVELAVRGYPQFTASSVEIEAKEKSYSIITLNKIKNMYRDSWIFFILGIDAFMEIQTWKSHEQILEQCHFIVISRPGYLLAEARNVLPRKKREKIHDLREVEEVEENLLSTYRIFLVSIQALDISSTEIRRKVREGRALSGLVPSEVEAYIRDRKLYQG